MSRTKKIAVLAIIAMVLTLMPAAMFAATADSTRLSGAGRVETALDIASAGTWGSTVILAPADDANLVDALAAAPLAGQENAPILLTFKGSLDAAVKAKIAALGATKVYVVGAISADVAAEVDAMTGVTVETLKGDGRQATAAAINAKLTSPAGTFVVGYDAVPDALSVASYAAKNKFAIVLANQDGSVAGSSLVGATKYIVGGTAKVDDITGVTRIFGADRFATNNAVASTLSFTYDRVYVANGVSCVDALAVAPLAAKYGAFVALSSASDVAAAATVNAKLSSSSKVIAVGGTSAVSNAVAGKVSYGTTAAFAVQSVTVINAKQLKVTFSSALDPVSSQLIANYVVKDASNTAITLLANPDGAVLQNDNKSVILNLTAGTGLLDTSYSVSISGVYASDAVTLVPAYFQVISVPADKTKPSVTSITSSTRGTTATSATVKFDEPVASASFTVDGAYATATWNNTRTVATLAGFTVTANAAHTFAVLAATDYNNNIAATYSQSLVPTVDTAAPTVTLSAISDSCIKATFSKKMDAATMIAGNVGVLDEALAPLAVTNITLDPADKGTQTIYNINLTTGAANPFVIQSTRTFTVTFRNMLDSLGNAMGSQNIALSVTKDTVAPTLQSVTYKKNGAGLVTDVVLTYNEPLTAVPGGVASANITVYNSTGVNSKAAIGIPANSDAVASGATQVEFTLTAPIALSGVYTFTFPVNMVTDRSFTANGSAPTTKTCDFGTSTGTYTIVPGTTVAAANVITVVYPVAVKGGSVTGSATDVNNYTINGAPLPAGTSIVLDGTSTTATITLTPGTVTATGNATFGINNVQSATGNTNVPFSKILVLADNTSPTVSAAANKALNTITINMSELVVTAPVTAAGPLAGIKIIKSDGSNVVAAGNATNVTYQVNPADTTKSQAVITFGAGTLSAANLTNASIYLPTGAIQDDAANPVLVTTLAVTDSFVADLGATAFVDAADGAGLTGADFTITGTTNVPETTVTYYVYIVSQASGVNITSANYTSYTAVATYTQATGLFSGGLSLANTILNDSLGNAFAATNYKVFVVTKDLAGNVSVTTTAAAAIDAD